MNPEDLIINVIMQLGDAKRQIAGLEDQLSKVTGVSNKMHQQMAHGASDATKAFEWQRLAVGKLAIHVAELASEFTVASLTVKEFVTAAEGVNAMIQHLGAIQVSAGMTNAAFREMKQGVIDAGISSGKTFEEMAHLAEMVVGESGIRKGVGDIVKSAALMERAFGGSADHFALFAADTQKLSRGLMSGTDTMRIFDGVIGTTGKKMDELVSSLGEIGKTLGHIVGGGRGFAQAFGGTGKFIAQTSALIDSLGGSASEFQDLVKGVLDPHRWADISHQIPGIASFLPQLQRALTQGDMEGAVRMFREAGAQTVNAFGAIDPLAAAAMGLNKNLAEVLSQIDMSKLQGQASQTESVMDRAQKRILGFGQSIQRLWNNLAASVMPVVGFIADKLGGALDFINNTLTNSPIAGYVVSWGLLGVAVLGAIQAFILFRAAAQGGGAALGEVGKGVGTAVSSIGSAAGTAIRGVMVGIGEGFSALSVGLLAMAPAIPVMLVMGGIFAVGLLALGLALRIATPAIEAMATMKGGDMLGAAAGMAVMAVSLPLLGAGFIILGAGMLAGAVGVAAFAAAARLFGPLKGGGVGGVLMGIAESFSFNGGKLAEVIGNMRMMRSFLKEFSIIAAEVAVLSGGAALATAVESVLAVFGIGSPMDMLATQGAAVATTINSLMKSFSVLVQNGATGVGGALAGAMTNASAFIKQLGPMIDAMVELGNHSSKLEDGFFANGPLTKIAKNLNGDAMAALKDLTISTKTQAEIALDGYQASTQQHQGRVEELLENILVAVKGQPAAAAPARTDRAWNPANVFTQFGDAEW